MSPSFQLDGTQGFAYLKLNAINPNPSNMCNGFLPVPIYYTGEIQNDGNDLGSATYTQEGGGGSVTFSKAPVDIPASETTNAVGFSSGALATMGQFRQTLNATCCDVNQDIFKGRQVSEKTGTGLTFDNCHFPGATPPPLTTVQGSLWNVGYYALDPPYIFSLNVWADDYVGWNTAQVAYYRRLLTPSSFPCGARVPQSMYIAVGGTSGFVNNYANGYIAAQIYLDHVTATRNDVSQSINR